MINIKLFRNYYYCFLLVTTSLLDSQWSRALKDSDGDPRPLDHSGFPQNHVSNPQNETELALAYERYRPNWFSTLWLDQDRQFFHDPGYGGIRRAISGPGSELFTQRPFVIWLSQFLKEKKIKSMVEGSCGHWPSGWQLYVDWPDRMEYTGVDLVQEVIDDVIERYVIPARQNLSDVSYDCVRCNLLKEILREKVQKTKVENGKVIQLKGKNIKLNFKQGNILQPDSESEEKKIPKFRDLLLTKDTLMHMPANGVKEYIERNLVVRIQSYNSSEEYFESDSDNDSESLSNSSQSESIQQRTQTVKCIPRYRYIVLVNNGCQQADLWHNNQTIKEEDRLKKPQCNDQRFKQWNSFTPLDLSREPYASQIVKILKDCGMSDHVKLDPDVFRYGNGTIGGEKIVQILDFTKYYREINNDSDSSLDNSNVSNLGRNEEL